MKIRDRLATAVERGDVNGDDVDSGAERRLLRLALGLRLTLCPERRRRLRNAARATSSCFMILLIANHANRQITSRKSY